MASNTTIFEFCVIFHARVYVNSKRRGSLKVFLQAIRHFLQHGRKLPSEEVSLDIFVE